MFWPIGPKKWSDLKLNATEAIITNAIAEAKNLAQEIIDAKDVAEVKAGGTVLEAEHKCASDAAWKVCPFGGLKVKDAKQSS